MTGKGNDIGHGNMQTCLLEKLYGSGNKKENQLYHMYCYARITYHRSRWTYYQAISNLLLLWPFVQIHRSLPFQFLEMCPNPSNKRYCSIKNTNTVFTKDNRFRFYFLPIVIVDSCLMISFKIHVYLREHVSVKYKAFVTAIVFIMHF